jgi:pimeloyl-ACP methyl ester carboxylesterase
VIEHRIKSDGVALRCVEWGDAKAPLLLHGLRAYAHWFDPFAEAAKDNYRVVALDQRGRGGSGWAADYTTDSYAADIAAVAVALELERSTLIGHSMGGANAVAFAARHPAAVSALVVVDSAPELDRAGLDRIRHELSVTPKSFATLDQARTFLRQLHAKASEQSIAARLQWMLAAGTDGAFGWRLDPAILDPRFAPDPPARMWDGLAALTCPTLFVRGAESDLVTPAVIDRMLKTVPGSTAVEIAGATHMVVEDNPKDFTAAVLTFLAAIQPALNARAS